MPRIDSHQHFWKYNTTEYSWISDEMEVIKSDFLAENLKEILDKNKIDGCIAVQARQHLQENEFLLDLALKNDFIKGIVAWVDLKSNLLEKELEKYSQNEKIKGFRHILQDEKDPNFMLNPQFINGIKLLDKFHFTYDLLVYENQFDTTIKFLDLFDNQRFVLDHIGKPNIKEGLSNNWKVGIKTLAENPNLYCKISGMVTEANWKNWEPEMFFPFLDILVEAFGTERLMFGSDWPVCLLATKNYGEVLHIIERYFQNFSVEEKDMIFGQNAIDFYSL